MAMPAIQTRQPIYMVELMERLGIDPGEGVVPRLGLSFATAFRRCEACPSKQTCREWLDSMPQSVSFAPAFCPNADIMFELQVDRPPLHRVIEGHASLADLERLEDEIDDALLCHEDDERLSAELKCRRLHLRDELAHVRCEGPKVRAS